MSKVVIVDIRRSPIGSFMGQFSSLSASSLASQVIQELVKGRDLKVDALILGQVLSAGNGQAPARQAALGAGLDESTICSTINKVCGSGLEAVLQASAMIQSKQAEIVIAGGMESMSKAPYYLDRVRQGYRLGHGEMLDSIIKDGLWDVYNDFHMGEAAELCADKFGISREAQDDYAKRSYTRSLESIREGLFKNEIVPISLESKKETLTLVEDEEPRKVKFDKFSKLSPVFNKLGTVTAANASTLNDGASACLMMTEDKARELGMTIMAVLKAGNRVAQDPKWFSTAPVTGIQKLQYEHRIDLKDIDLFEINEAFSVVALAAERELKLNFEKLNVHGGAVSLGHPIGASGCRILCTLIHALHHYQKRQGLASLCIGGGEACTLLIEKPE